VAFEAEAWRPNRLGEPFDVTVPEEVKRIKK